MQMPARTRVSQALTHPAQGRDKSRSGTGLSDWEKKREKCVCKNKTKQKRKTELFRLHSSVFVSSYPTGTCPLLTIHGGDTGQGCGFVGGEADRLVHGIWENAMSQLGSGNDLASCQKEGLGELGAPKIKGVK